MHGHEGPVAEWTPGFSGAQPPITPDTPALHAEDRLSAAHRISVTGEHRRLAFKLKSLLVFGTDPSDH